MAASHALYQLSYGPLFVLLSALMLRCASEHSGHTGETSYLPAVPGTGTPAGRTGRPPCRRIADGSHGSECSGQRRRHSDPPDCWRISLHAANPSQNTIDTYIDSLDSFTRYLVSNGMPTQVASSPASVSTHGSPISPRRPAPRLPATGTQGFGFSSCGPTPRAKSARCRCGT
jgi:hypothetical protein